MVLPIQLPNQYPVNSTDYLLLLFHKQLRKQGKTGNVVRTVLYFDGTISLTQLQNLVHQNQLLSSLNSYRVHESFPGKPSWWKLGPSPLPVSVSECFSPSNSIPTEILQLNLDPWGDGLIHLHLLNLPESKQALVVSVNHCFTDYRGVQELVQLILQPSHPLNPNLVSKPDIELTFWPKLTNSLKIVGFMLKSITSSIATIGNRKLGKDFQTKRIIFSESQSQTIDKDIQSKGLSLLPNVYFLAKTIWSFHTQIGFKQGNLLWLSIPIDSRKKGTPASILGNNLWFMFYQIPLSILSKGFPELVQQLQQQTLDQLKLQLPQKYAIMASWWKALPHSIYRIFVNMPSRGRISSLSFSNLGNCFPNLNNVLGHPIIGIENIPSNPSPPGIGIVIMKWNNQYAINLTWEKNLLSYSEVEAIILQLSQLPQSSD